jgi:anti-sigma regulatory factor (Ser/Thr protein kinase)
MSLHHRSLAIREFIIGMVRLHPTDIARVTASHFGITTQAARNHLGALESSGVLKSTGRTKAKAYVLQTLATLIRIYPANGLMEDVVWRQDFKPQLEGHVSENVMDICGIVFSEMLNNAIDHSETDEILVEMVHTAAMTSFSISDRGIGIFRKVKEALGLPEERMAILELSKGKLTTSSENHSGYGIFFSSRMADLFSIGSGKLFFNHSGPDNDWLLESRGDYIGTRVDFSVDASTKRTPAEVYNEFCATPGEEEPGMAFRKTHVPLRLAQFGTDQLVSRSQAKRVLARFDRFSEVLIDFTGVPFIGQAFADEIFRVFAKQHPHVSIIPMAACREVMQMIQLARNPDLPSQQRLFE